MPPKTPKQLREEIKRANEEPSEPGRERTAEGMETRTPTRGEFFGNLGKLARKPPQRRDADTAN